MKLVISSILFLICLTFHSYALAYNDSYLPQLNLGEPGDKAGDIIAPITNEEVKAWCDFSKAIVLTNRGFLCVFNGKPLP